MGGTFIRLATQGHDVHVAYETSGNVAVHDDVVLQHMDAAFQLGFGDRFDEVKKLIDSKKPGEPEPRELLNIKGAIRRSEARGAVRSFGLNDNTNAHFLNLPFYESGGIKKNPRTQADVDIIKKLMNELKPDMIFSDIRMPGMTGLELLKLLPEISPHSRLILISGYAEFSYAQEAVQNHAYDYLLKPIKEEELERVVRVLSEREATSKPISRSFLTRNVGVPVSNQ